MSDATEDDGILEVVSQIQSFCGLWGDLKTPEDLSGVSFLRKTFAPLVKGKGKG